MAEQEAVGILYSASVGMAVVEVKEFEQLCQALLSGTCRFLNIFNFTFQRQTKIEQRFTKLVDVVDGIVVLVVA